MTTDGLEFTKILCDEQGRRDDHVQHLTGHVTDMGAIDPDWHARPQTLDVMHDVTFLLVQRIVVLTIHVNVIVTIDGGSGSRGPTTGSTSCSGSKLRCQELPLFTLLLIIDIVDIFDTVAFPVGTTKVVLQMADTLQLGLFIVQYRHQYVVPRPSLLIE